MFNEIVKKLNQANVIARVVLHQQNYITVEAENDVQARDALGMDRFRQLVNDVEIVII